MFPLEVNTLGVTFSNPVQKNLIQEKNPAQKGEVFFNGSRLVRLMTSLFEAVLEDHLRERKRIAVMAGVVIFDLDGAGDRIQKIDGDRMDRRRAIGRIDNRAGERGLRKNICAGKQ